MANLVYAKQPNHVVVIVVLQARLSRCSRDSIETGVSQVVAFIFVFILDLQPPERWSQETLRCRLQNWKGHVHCKWWHQKNNALWLYNVTLVTKGDDKPSMVVMLACTG